MNHKYRKKPVIITAMPFDGTLASQLAICKAFSGLRTSRLELKDGAVYDWRIKTLEGEHKVSAGDFVIQGVKGEFYPCKPDIFAMTYEKVES